MYKIFQPAISIMNKLSYRVKITILAFVSMVSFIYPTYSAFDEIVSQKERYEIQMVGLEYYKNYYLLLESISYYQLSLEKRNSSKMTHQMEKLFQKVEEFDKENLNIASDELKIIKDKFNSFNHLCSFDAQWECNCPGREFNYMGCCFSRRRGKFNSGI